MARFQENDPITLITFYYMPAKCQGMLFFSLLVDLIFYDQNQAGIVGKMTAKILDHKPPALIILMLAGMQCVLYMSDSCLNYSC